MRLKEVTVTADPSLLRRLADFFLHAAEQMEEHGPGFGHAHFCDFARVPAVKQRQADIIVVGDGLRLDDALVTNDWRNELPGLVRVAALGERDVVSNLLRQGAGPNEVDEDGWSALHAAAVFDHPEIVALLLEAGAAVDARDNQGFTPLLNAPEAGAAVVAALLDEGADPMAQDLALGCRPLDRFAEHGNAVGVQLLLDVGVDVDARDSPEGTTALMDAAEAGSTECVRLLLRAGADASLTAGGETASTLALKHGHHALAALLAAAE